MTAPAVADPRAAEPALPQPRAMYRFALLLVVSVVLLIVLGGMVTSTGSGMAFADWPLANGSFWPPDMGLDGLFEHGHRVFGALVGLLTTILAVWILLREPRVWVRHLAVWAWILVVAQGVIGGVGVLKNLPWATSITHGVLAQVFLCVTALLAFAVSPAWHLRVRAPAGMAAMARRLAGVSLVLVFAQLLIGAMARHTRLAELVWTHVGLAFFVAIGLLLAGLYTAAKFTAVPAFQRLGRVVVVVMSVQLLLGFVTLMVRRVKDPSNIEHLGRAAVTTLHVVVGAVLFLCVALLLYRLVRNVEPMPIEGSDA